MENTAKNERDSEFFVSVDGEIQLCCVWTNKKKRQFYIKNGSWATEFNENWEILCPVTGLILRKGRKVRIHYDVLSDGSGTCTEKIQQAQQKLDNIRSGRKQ